MNKLFIIGNGFDLAHGLKTKYVDFILWYLNKSFKTANFGRYTDKHISILPTRGYPNKEFTSISDYFKFIKEYDIKVHFQHRFLENLILNCRDNNWVDIESKYYYYLIKAYKIAESIDFDVKDFINTDLISLNESFDYIREKLIEYLFEIERIPKNINEEISETLQNEMKAGNLKNEKSRNFILIFNYTSTIEIYSELFQNAQFNYIHGKLNDTSNPIIFGYGDEIDSYYQKIENLGVNMYLDNIKSFSYFKSENYLNLTRFLDSEEYYVSIIGHSCGLSDRVLLNTIFEHHYCKRIKIFYYQKNKIENDFFEKTQEISRHFKPENKSKMRKLIVPIKNCKPLTRLEND